jgi:hypothetical protein
MNASEDRLAVRLGRSVMSDQRPDYPRERTSAPHHGMSHECQEPTFARFLRNALRNAGYRL